MASALDAAVSERRRTFDALRQRREADLRFLHAEAKAFAEDTK
jgi:hypothetical protein